MAVTREQLRDWLKAAGGSDDRLRLDAERRLAILPRAVVQEYIPTLWEELKTDFRRRQKMGISLILILFGLALSYFFIRIIFWKKNGMTFPFHMFTMFIGPMISCMNQKKPELQGIVYVLTQHQYPELTPCLIEALPIADTTSTNGGVRRSELVMAALAALLPRYVALDLPDLNEKQRKILREQLRRYSKKLRDPSAVLTDVESAFLTAVLTFLRREQEPRGDKRMVQTMESLALEPVDVAQEHRERRQVREAARQAIVRLYG